MAYVYKGSGQSQDLLFEKSPREIYLESVRKPPKVLIDPAKGNRYLEDEEARKKARAESRKRWYENNKAEHNRKRALKRKESQT